MISPAVLVILIAVSIASAERRPKGDAMPGHDHCDSGNVVRISKINGFFQFGAFARCSGHPHRCVDHMSMELTEFSRSKPKQRLVDSMLALVLVLLSAGSVLSELPDCSANSTLPEGLDLFYGHRDHFFWLHKMKPDEENFYDVGIITEWTTSKNISSVHPISENRFLIVYTDSVYYNVYAVIYKMDCSLLFKKHHYRINAVKLPYAVHLPELVELGVLHTSKSSFLDENRTLHFRRGHAYGIELTGETTFTAQYTELDSSEEIDRAIDTKIQFAEKNDVWNIEGSIFSRNLPDKVTTRCRMMPEWKRVGGVLSSSQCQSSSSGSAGSHHNQKTAVVVVSIIIGLLFALV